MCNSRTRESSWRLGVARPREQHAIADPVGPVRRLPGRSGGGGKQPARSPGLPACDPAAWDRAVCACAPYTCPLLFCPRDAAGETGRRRREDARGCAEDGELFSKMPGGLTPPRISHLLYRLPAPSPGSLLPLLLSVKSPPPPPPAPSRFATIICFDLLLLLLLRLSLYSSIAPSSSSAPSRARSSSLPPVSLLSQPDALLRD